MTETIAVIDFETTGISPDWGSRATEIAVVLVQDGRIVDRYASLMNAGVHVPYFIEQLTGISNAMVRGAPPAARVMAEAAEFVGCHPLVAHNASFDRKFWDAELARCHAPRSGEFACSMLLSRRIYPDAPNHRLGTLVHHTNIPVDAPFHRAMADATMAARLLLLMQEELRARYSLADVPHELLRKVQRTPLARLDRAIDSFLGRRTKRGRGGRTSST
jgi:DNA polymerase-3 subunit epsilon